MLLQRGKTSEIGVALNPQSEDGGAEAVVLRARSVYSSSIKTRVPEEEGLTIDKRTTCVGQPE